jgi:hypothetical protein
MLVCPFCLTFASCVRFEVKWQRENEAKEQEQEEKE